MKIEIEQKTAEGLKSYLQKHKSFESVNELVNHILGDFLSRIEDIETLEERSDDARVRQVRQRLRDLGYL